MDAVRAGAPDSVCVPFLQSVLIPEGVVADRERWGMRDDVTTFAFSFDTLSDSNRKNPLGLVRAFQAAFPSRDDVALLIKVAHLDDDTRLGGQAVKAVAAAADDDRITFLQEALPYADVLGLYASADVVASLHRSEGLGLLMMEAMSLGTPVLATGYSGNLDFMTADNSMLIDSQMVTVDTPYPGYQHLQGVDVWAEPDQESAVRAMRALADDPGASWAARRTWAPRHGDAPRPGRWWRPRERAGSCRRGSSCLGRSSFSAPQALVVCPPTEVSLGMGRRPAPGGRQAETGPPTVSRPSAPRGVEREVDEQVRVG